MITRYIEIEKESQMKHIVPIAMCLVLSLGCSKKGEECPLLIDALDKYEKSVNDQKTDLNKGDAASLLEASKTINAFVSALKTQKMNIAVLPLTDERLLELRRTVIPHFDKSAALFNEFSTQLILAVKTETMNIDFESKLEKEKTEINAFCEKEIRNRRARRKQNKACRKVAPIVDKLVFKELLPPKIDTITDALAEASESNDAFKKPVEEINKILMSMKVLLEKRTEVDKKIDSIRNKILNHKKSLGQVEKEIGMYCSSE